VLEPVVDDLRRHVAEALPGLDPEPVHREACLYTITPDGDFILDVIDGVVVCGGDSGHAFKFGPLLGRFCADLAQGRPLPAECDRFRADRFAGAAA
jgi:sarcosine oxidase